MKASLSKSTRRKTTTKTDNVSKKKKKSETVTLLSIEPQKKGDAYKTAAGKVGGVFSVPNSETGGWRVSFELQPEGAKLSELRCVLLVEAGPLSETWLYRWTA